MKRHIDQRKVKFLSRLGNGLVIAGIVVLFISLALMLRQSYGVNLPVLMALVGTMISQVGLALVSRWGRRPRIDEILDASLKGLDDRVALFHYALGASHALICPSGVFALVPYQDQGVVEYADGKWWITRPRRGLFRPGGRRRLGDLASEGASESGRLSRALRRYIPAMDEVEVRPIFVFVHPKADLTVEGAPELTAHVKKLKELVRHLPKGSSLTPEQLAVVTEAVHLPGE